MLFFWKFVFWFPKISFLFNIFIDKFLSPQYNKIMQKTDYKSEFIFHINHEYRAKPLHFECMRLVQIGRMLCTPATAIRTHVHLDWFELTVVTGGKGKVEVNGTLIPVREGDVVLSLPCDSHAVYSDEKSPLQYDFFSFLCEDNELKSRFDHLILTVYPAEKRKLREEKISSLISTALEELESKMPDKDCVLKAVFKQILIYTARAFEGESLPNSHLSDVQILCFKVMHYLDTHLYTLKNLYELSEVTNYNYSYLSFIFKNTTGITLAEYYQNKKLAAAKALIKEGKLKAGEIAELLNYSSIFAFSKAFKNHYGISPTKLQ